MFALPDQFVALQRQSLESVKAIAMASFAGFEKLTQLNVQAAKASLEESVQRSMSLLQTNDAGALAETFTEAVKPAGDKLTAYAKHVYDIASETREEISRVVERQFSESNRQLTDSIDAIAKNSPTGVVTMVKSALTTANATWDQVNKASQQAAETTDATVANVTNEVLTASATSSSGQARH